MHLLTCLISFPSLHLKDKINTSIIIEKEKRKRKGETEAEKKKKKRKSSPISSSTEIFSCLPLFICNCVKSIFFYCRLGPRATTIFLMTKITFQSYKKFRPQPKKHKGNIDFEKKLYGADKPLFSLKREKGKKMRHASAFGTQTSKMLSSFWLCWCSFFLREV